MILSAIYNKGKIYFKHYELSGVFPLLSRTALMNTANSGTVSLMKQTDCFPCSSSSAIGKDYMMRKLSPHGASFWKERDKYRT